MLYYLYSTFGINLFQYITFRAGLSFFLAFGISIALMPYFIEWAKKTKASQPISEFIPHQSKQNTPTMGGVVFIFCTVFACAFCMDLHNPYALLGIGCLIGFGFIGARDDYMKIAARSNAGMSARVKMALLLMLAFVVSLVLINIGHSAEFYIPFVKSPLFDMKEHLSFSVGFVLVPLICLAFWMLVFSATTNAVNITDGLDGLATVPSIFALITLSVFVYVAGHLELASYLLYPRVVNGGELIVVSCALIGALFGFLWYNCHPAEVFMGDSGSLAIGGFIAYMAIVSSNEILLILIGIVFVFETLSVMLQVGSYKYRQKRIFLMAPIHHHFEKKGWAENKIIVRFWVISILANILALITLKIR